MFKKMIISTLGMVTLASVGLGAHAESPSFNFVEGGYTESNDFSGFGMRGNFEINDYLFAVGRFNRSTDDDEGIDLNYTEASFGLGLKMDINSSTALYTSAEYYSAEISTDFFGEDFSIDDDGALLSLGIRTMITDTTELYSEVNHYNMDNHTTMLAVGARQGITENLGVFAEYKVADNGDDSDGYFLGVSLKF